MNRFTDLAFAADSEGIYDLVIDTPVRDMRLTAGLESAEFISLFSDRRARPDEVASPLERRGWIGDTLSDVPDDTHGSGIWLYEQRRLTADVVAGLRLEAEASLRWQVPEIAKSISAQIVSDPAKRSATLVITQTFASGGRSSRSWALADATRQGLLVRL